MVAAVVMRCRLRSFWACTDSIRMISYHYHNVDDTKTDKYRIRTRDNRVIFHSIYS